MLSQEDGFGYNERLFSGGFRTRLHTARFRWLVATLQRLACPMDKVLELGCFDGKLLDFLPALPQRYVGFDANWEGGLDLARERWSGHANFAFHKALAADDMDLADERFELAVAMETLEHIPPARVDAYLARIARHLDGYFLVTVPNEKGPVFLAKWLIKTLLSKDSERYTAAEVVNATLGRMHRVGRNEHKGFDYAELVARMNRYFVIERVCGHPFSFLPTSLCFGVGIVARPRR
ncbi:MAG: class I SAM-dependent methyltransferase [Thiotrichales bacterium]